MHFLSFLLTDEHDLNYTKKAEKVTSYVFFAYSLMS